MYRRYQILNLELCIMFNKEIMKSREECDSEIIPPGQHFGVPGVAPHNLEQ
jgi:hypothetical protein